MSGIISKAVKIGALVTLGLGVAAIVDLIKADTGSGIKKCPLDPDTKKKLEDTQDALRQMTSKYTISCSPCFDWLKQKSILLIT